MSKTKLLCNLKAGERFRTDDGLICRKTDFSVRDYKGKKKYMCETDDGGRYLPSTLRVEIMEGMDNEEGDQT